jgi:hypothetical protein
MDISSFLNPADESLELAGGSEAELSSEALVEQLITEASATTINIYPDDEGDAPEPAPLPKPLDALNAVQLLISYIEGQDTSKNPSSSVSRAF